MAIYKVKDPQGNIREISGPDGASDAEIIAQAQKLLSTPKKEVRQVDINGPKPQEMSFIEGVGELAMGGLRGASRIGNTLMRPLDAMGITDRTNQERKAATEQFFKDKADTDSGLFQAGDIGAQIAGTAGVGGVLGKGVMAASKYIPAISNIAPKVATALESGGFRVNPANMVGPMAPVSALGKVGDAALRAGAGAVTGGSMAGLVDPENASTGALIGGVAPGVVKAAGMAGSAIGNAGRKALNPVLSKTLADAQQVGYVVPPSMAGAGLGSRVLEGISGKYKTNQLAGIKNQAVTDNLARKALGVADNVPLTSETTQAVRNAAFKSGYEPVTQITTPMLTGQKYVNALDSIANKYRGPARSFPAAEKEAVTSLVDKYKVKMFNADDAIKTIQNLRDDAADAFRTGDKALGKAQREIAKAIEDQVERQLNGMGKSGSALLKNFRDARKQMAIAHTVEDAIREGGGVVDAKVFGRAIQKGKPLSGELAIAGKFANNFGDVAGVPKSGHANPFTVLDFFTGGVGAGAGATPLALLPAARVGARYGILSNPYQKAFVGPNSTQFPAISGALADPTLRAGLLTATNP